MSYNLNYHYQNYVKRGSVKVLYEGVELGGECWSTAKGVASGGCASGTKCSAWNPDGGDWDGSSPWYCLAKPELAEGAACDYANKVKS